MSLTTTLLATCLLLTTSLTQTPPGGFPAIPGVVPARPEDEEHTRCVIDCMARAEEDPFACTRCSSIPKITAEDALAIQDCYQGCSDNNSPSNVSGITECFAGCESDFISTGDGVKIAKDPPEETEEEQSDEDEKEEKEKEKEKDDKKDREKDKDKDKDDDEDEDEDEKDAKTAEDTDEDEEEGDDELGAGPGDRAAGGESDNDDERNDRNSPVFPSTASSWRWWLSYGHALSLSVLVVIANRVVC